MPFWCILTPELPCAFTRQHLTCKCGMIVVEGHIIILITDLATLASYPQRYNTYFVDFILCRGSGRQCCYDERGRLIVGPTAGGHSDFISPYTYSLSRLPSFVLRLHLQFDITPFLHCCRSSETSCTTFYDFRPSAVSNCQYSPPPPGRFYWLVLSVHAPMRDIRMQFSWVGARYVLRLWEIWMLVSKGLRKQTLWILINAQGALLRKEFGFFWTDGKDISIASPTVHPWRYELWI